MKNKKSVKITQEDLFKSMAPLTYKRHKKEMANKPLPTDIIVRDSDRVGYPVAIGQMLPRIKARILAKIAGKS